MKMPQKMSKIGISIVLAGILVLPLTAAAGMGKGYGRGNSGQCASSLMTLPKGELSVEETDTLLHMRQEEKLARDVYLKLHEQWGHQTFANIARSEQRQMDAIKILIDKYELTDPVTDDSRGVFTDTDLQNFYNELTSSGQESLAEALKVGATVEDLDIRDLLKAFEESDDEDVRTVYQNLMKGSRNHLRAFVYQLSLNNAEYAPQYITVEAYNSIISSPAERGYYNEEGEPFGGFGCGRNGRGNRGQGRCIAPNAGVSWNSHVNLLSRGGNGNGSGQGPGDGTGNGGNGPKDGTGNGKKSGDCVNSATAWNSDNNLLSGNGQGPGDGTGNGGNGPKDGTGNGKKSGDCVNSATAWNADNNLLSRNGSGQGPGDGTGNGGNGPKDGTGNGKKSGGCVNSATAWNADNNLLSRNGGGRGNGGGQGPGDGTGNGGKRPKDGTGNGKKSGGCVNS